jgi:hypothetical protein
MHADRHAGYGSCFCRQTEMHSESQACVRKHRQRDLYVERHADKKRVCMKTGMYINGYGSRQSCYVDRKKGKVIVTGIYEYVILYRRRRHLDGHAVQAVRHAKQADTHSIEGHSSR